MECIPVCGAQGRGSGRTNETWNRDGVRFAMRRRKRGWRSLRAPGRCRVSCESTRADCGANEPLNRGTTPGASAFLGEPRHRAAWQPDRYWILCTDGARRNVCFAASVLDHSMTARGRSRTAKVTARRGAIGVQLTFGRFQPMFLTSPLPTPQPCRCKPPSAEASRPRGGSVQTARGTQPTPGNRNAIRVPPVSPRAPAPTLPRSDLPGQHPRVDTR